MEGFKLADCEYNRVIKGTNAIRRSATEGTTRRAGVLTGGCTVVPPCARELEVEPFPG